MYKPVVLFCCVLFSLFLLVSYFKFDFKPYNNNDNGGYNYSEQKVWGSKPIYSKDPAIRQIKYTSSKQPVVSAGNICAFVNYIFQVDVGSGIHVINNSVPENADRVGFVTVLGCTQMSIKGHYLYANSLNDLVTLDISDIKNVKEVSRIKDAFPENIDYPLIQPKESGYYQCPTSDSIVIGWVKDSISNYSCYKP